MDQDIGFAQSGAGEEGKTGFYNDDEEEEEEEEEEGDRGVVGEHDEAEASGSSNSSDGDYDEVYWIQWFVSLKGNEFICEVEEEYIQDEFNLTGINAIVPFYNYALDMVLDVDIPTDRFTEEQLEAIEASTEILYGLIHARYILTARGMQRMREKYDAVEFGRCPRVNCQGQPVLPVGLSDIPAKHCVNLFCPSCRDIFYPKSARQATLDGAYFGTTFAHLFLMCNEDLQYAKPQASYVPRVFGFRIHKDSSYWRQGTAVITDGSSISRPTELNQKEREGQNNDDSSASTSVLDGASELAATKGLKLNIPAPPSNMHAQRVQEKTSLPRPPT